MSFWSSVVDKVRSTMAGAGDAPITSTSNNGKIICLFDVDGTLTKPRQRISPEMDAFLEELKQKRPDIHFGIVGGSDLVKIAEQMGSKDANVAQTDLLEKFEYVFAENGLVAYVNGILKGKDSILNFMGNERLQKLINFCLGYMSNLWLPCKRGNFIEFRTGLLNICPIGRSCSQREREEFAIFDQEHQIREKFVEALKEKFGDEYGLNFVIGGQISIDVFPRGWDKTYCLKYLEDFDRIYFFGDKTFPGGNDYEIFTHVRTTGFTVASPEETKERLKDLFGIP